MNVHYPFLFVFIFCFLIKSSAQPVSGELQKAYYQLLELKVDSASLIINHNYSRGTDRAFKIYILSLRDLLKLLLIHDESYYQVYNNFEKKYLDELESIQENVDFVSFIKAEVKLHAAIIRFRYDDQFSGAIRFIQSYNLIKLITDKDNAPPYFFKTSGVLNVLLSVIPDRYDFFLKLIGIHADLSEGIKQLQKVRTTGHLFQFEGYMIMGLLDAYYLNNPDQSAFIIKETAENWRYSLLYQFLRGLISMKSRDNEQSIEAFSSCSSFDDSYMKIPSATFFLAESLLKKLQFDAARENYFHYLNSNNTGEFVKATFYRLSLISNFSHEMELSEFYRKKVLSEGTLVTETDNYVYSLVKNNYRPHPEIQKSRLLFDGGYFQESLDILKAVEANKLTDEEKLEFEYRLARTYQLQNNYSGAIVHYENMFKSSFQDHYLVANAHLQMGKILYQMGDRERSIDHYKEALRYTGEYYRGSIRNEAKTGLSLID